jgi:uncharacterized repeat protein (TIGR03806 family)
MRKLAALLVLFLAACGSEETPPTFHSDSNPQRLSDWGMLTARDGALQLGEGVTPYDLATPLFTDYALKLRTVWIPQGAATYTADDAFDFPVGTVLTKTFFYPIKGDAWTGAVTYGVEHTVEGGLMTLDGYRLMETRILVRRKDGWDALPYVWNEDQTDAVLKRTGAVMPLTLHRPDGRTEAFAYVVPNANQCAACHATNAITKEIAPIGPKARHLNKRSTFSPAFEQLDYWVAAGLLTGDISDGATVKKSTDWTDKSLPLEARARAYLDINCSHCHNPGGAADTSGLNLEPSATGPALGRCKSPIAAGSGSGGRAFDITPGHPEQSITIFRMETTDPGAMMPELGRSTTHDEGVALIAEWIAKMEGACG